MAGLEPKVDFLPYTGIIVKDKAPCLWKNTGKICVKEIKLIQYFNPDPSPLISFDKPVLQNTIKYCETKLRVKERNKQKPFLLSFTKL
jgi:hypothetical protein